MGKIFLSLVRYSIPPRCVLNASTTIYPNIGLLRVCFELFDKRISNFACHIQDDVVLSTLLGRRLQIEVDMRLVNADRAIRVCFWFLFLR